MNYQQMTEFIAHRTGLDDSVAESAFRTFLRTIGHYLPEFDSNAIVREIPEVSGVFATRAVIEEDTFHTFILRLASALDVEEGEAFEIATAAGQALAEGLSDEGLKHLRHDLDDEFGALFVRGERTRTAQVHRIGGGDTLSTGRPGSSKPLSEADVAQADSIAVTDDPKQNRLAAGHGTEQERLKHTLADGKPGSTRPISE